MAKAKKVVTCQKPKKIANCKINKIANNGKINKISKGKKAKNKNGCRPKGKRATPRNGYLIFWKEVKERLQKKDPCIRVTEISRRAGACWKQLSDEDKDAYRARACGREGTKCICPTCKRVLPRAVKAKK